MSFTLVGEMTDVNSGGTTSPKQPKPYVYQRLDSDSGEIRLLRVPRKFSAGADSDTSADYTIFHTSLHDGLDFAALSYCWGVPTFDHELIIDGSLMYVTESLAAALQSLRFEDHDLLLWADSICINQQDAIEKTAQVQMMRDIYRAAARVIIWLGPSTPQTFYTVQEMRKLGSTLVEMGMAELSTHQILYWNVEDDDNSKPAATVRAILQLKSGHLRQAFNGELPFWWIMSDLGKRKWYHVSTSTNAALEISL